MSVHPRVSRSSLGGILLPMRDEDPTAVETAFFTALAVHLPQVQDWYHRDADGLLWMTASVDDVRNGRMLATWRCDYDGHRLLGGASPAFLNWDDGVRALDAGVVVAGPEGLDAIETDPNRAAETAASWFRA